MKKRGLMKYKWQVAVMMLVLFCLNLVDVYKRQLLKSCSVYKEIALSQLTEEELA